MFVYQFLLSRFFLICAVIDDDEELDYEEGSSSHTDSSSPPQERYRSPPPTPYQEQLSGQGMPLSHSMSQPHNLVPMLPFFNGILPDTQLTANYGLGDVTNILPQLKSLFTQLMEMVHQTTLTFVLRGQRQAVTDDDDQIYIEEEETVDDDSTSTGFDSCEESEDDNEQEECDMKTEEPTSSISSRLANLTLNEQLRLHLSTLLSRIEQRVRQTSPLTSCIH